MNCTKCNKVATSYLGWNIYFCEDCDEEFGKQIASPIPTIIVMIAFVVFLVIAVII